MNTDELDAEKQAERSEAELRDSYQHFMSQW